MSFSEKHSRAFQEAGSEDLVEVLDMMHAFFSAESYPFDRESRLSNLEEFIKNGALGRLYLIQSGDKIAGYFALTFGYTFEYGGKDAFLDELYLKPEFRGQGLGTQAMDFIFEVAPKLGLHSIHLEVEEENVAAQKLYQKNGFISKKRLLWTRPL